MINVDSSFMKDYCLTDTIEKEILDFVGEDKEGLRLAKLLLDKLTMLELTDFQILSEFKVLWRKVGATKQLVTA